MCSERELGRVVGPAECGLFHNQTYCTRTVEGHKSRCESESQVKGKLMRIVLALQSILSRAQYSNTVMRLRHLAGLGSNVSGPSPSSALSAGPRPPVSFHAGEHETIPAVPESDSHTLFVLRPLWGHVPPISFSESKLYFHRILFRNAHPSLSFTPKFFIGLKNVYGLLGCLKVYPMS